ncbi:prolyl oligopeptidase family serine peptidase [Joostella sp. CR20]|uniref:prolyl oligopeptidase family serine peptidase n=1 Tax=Joostella sp. CR20 TaxID=2804312 RepID=UPI00313CE3C2
MKNIGLTFLFILFISSITFAQERFKDAIFNDISVETFTYADTLQLDFYNAEKNITANRPLLILVHGGGFSSGKRDNPLEKEFCVAMAKKGYAVASMSYHLTRKGASFGCDYNSEGKKETFNAVTKDILDATSFLIQQSNKLKFNSKQIVLVGSSAGAEAVLNTVYMPNASNIKYAGVVSFAGALVSIEHITKQRAIPTVLFHGVKDNLVPYYIAPHHYCKPNQPGFLTLFGSKAIADKLESLNKPYLLATDPEGNHDWANLAYQYTNEIAKFIASTVVEKENISTKMNVSK